MKKYLIISFMALLIFSCYKNEKTENGKIIPVQLTEKFQTVRNEADNVDSPAFWKGNNGENWIISTAKSTDLLLVDDALTGVNIKKIGSKGNKLGQLSRPNGIFVVDSLCFVVERDNRRVQVFSLPNFNSIGTFGDSTLIKPYGIFLTRDKNKFEVFITDNYEFEEDQVPADSLLGKRVHKYFITLNEGKIIQDSVQFIGETSGDGVLHIVESIWGDKSNNLLFIAEEDTSKSAIKIYNLNGKYTGRSFGQDMFFGQIEGITLYDEKKDGNGFWIITDQSHSANTFHIFDRKTMQHLAAFSGKKTTNTDGIWLAQSPFGTFAEGTFFAVHNDGNVSCFDFAEIKKLVRK